MSIKEDFRKIVELQKIDLEIFTLTKEKDSRIPTLLKELEEKVEIKKKELGALEEVFKNVQLKKKEKEIELGSKEEILRKAQTQLYQLKTNKEYQAKLNEIGTLKSDISVAEEDVLVALDDIEKSKVDLNEKKNILNKEETALKDEQTRLGERLGEINTRIKALNSKRTVFAQKIDKKILARYEDLIKTRDGLAAVAVKNSTCGACYMRVNHQTINQIKMYSELVICENCVRILYIPEDLEL